MKILFDLDYTLLDTVKFKEALVKAVSSCGPSPEKYDAAYAETVAKKGLFDPDDLFAALSAEFPDEDAAREARARFGRVLGSTEAFLYPGAKELLETLRKHDATVDLMTFGNADWQRKKVEHSGLAGLFDEVIATEKEKKGIVREAGRGEDKVIIVNDNGQEMKDMMAEAPEYTYVLKKGPKAVPSDLRLPTAETIDDLAVILERETGWELRREMDEASRERKEGRVVREGEDARGEIDMRDETGGEPSAPFAGVRR
jgi:phosphoglycolate phosphatase-like HAD superfamily hydrolase